MELKKLQLKNINDIKEIYLEAFPKAERKPFFALKHSVKAGKIKMYSAVADKEILGFVAVIPFENMVMVDYLAVNSKIRSKGTGSFIMREICEIYKDKTIVLLIEKLDDEADNKDQRIARRKFYTKNGFTSSDIFITGKSGDMEIMNYGGRVSKEEYLSLQKYALGNLFFRFANIKIQQKIN